MESKEDSILFIKDDLLPEMVHDRCFCTPNSREFVEFESATVEPVDLPEKFGRYCEIYRARLITRFSGEPQRFPLIIKFLSNSNDSETSFEAFQNEEMFYTKMTLKYGKDYTPKHYLSDLGKYGRPVIVLEDLEATGYKTVQDKLDDDHLKICVQLLGSFHGKGLKLKNENFSAFREFYAKFLEISLPDMSDEECQKKLIRITNILKTLSDTKLADKVKEKIGDNPVKTARTLASDINDDSTICHGHFSRDNLHFAYENQKPIGVKVIDWQTMRYCSPAIDLGFILSSNFSDENQPTRFKELIQLYVDSVRSEFSEISADRLTKDILSKFLLPWILLSFEDKVTDKELARVLELLGSLSAFD